MPKGTCIAGRGRSARGAATPRAAWPGCQRAARSRRVKRASKLATYWPLVLALVLLLGSRSHAEDRPNVLMIILDDLNDWVGFLDGHPNVQTPHMDRLAQRGIVYTEAYCVSPICGPSRAAVLTGMRPETTGAFTNQGNYRNYAPGAETFPEYFRRHGYKALAAGKVNHDLGIPDPQLWDENGPDCGVLGTPFIGDELDVQPVGESRTISRDGLDVTLPANGGLSAIDRPTMSWNSFDWAPLDVPDEDFPDGKIAAWGARQLGSQHDRPFLLVAGFYKPHQPFFAPKQYFDLHRRSGANAVALPPTLAGDLLDVPRPGVALARQPWSSGAHRTVVQHNAWHDAVHAYLATVSFVDAQVGRLLDALDHGPHRDNTWIVLWSDHGWSLGSKEHWGKHAPWRENVRVPLVIVPPVHGGPQHIQEFISRAPRSRSDGDFGSHTPAAFVTHRRPVSLLDLYPTLLGMCNLPPADHVEGRNLLNSDVADPLTDPNCHAVATIGRGTHSIVTPQWRYVRYFDGSEELYDRTTDPHEWHNVAAKAEHRGVKEHLARFAPPAKRYKQFVGWRSYKCVIPLKGAAMLFDYAATFGISEHDDIAGQRPDLVAAIRNYLKAEQITNRYVRIPSDAIEFTAAGDETNP